MNLLQERAAALLGQEAALFVPTATMANQIALKLHTRPGDVLVAEKHAHVVIYEYGGAAAHAGLMIEAIAGTNGRIGVGQLRDATEPSTKGADQRATLLALENTHNSSGGRCWPLEELEELTAAARGRGLATHLDGARLLNAAVATDVPAARLGGLFDTVTLCLSKGLGCPLGAILAGSQGTIERAWREKHLFGGAMRQAGIVAAAGVYALEHHVDRLADDHGRARRLAEGWHAAGLPVEPETVETNFVQLRVDAARPDEGRRARSPPRGRSRALVHDPPDGDPRGHASRPRRRGHRPRDRARAARARDPCRCLTSSALGSSGWSRPCSPRSARRRSSRPSSVTARSSGAGRSATPSWRVPSPRLPRTPIGSGRSRRRSRPSASSSSATPARWPSTIRCAPMFPRFRPARPSPTRSRT